MDRIKTAGNNGFCASGADGININICAAIISSLGRPNAIEQTNEKSTFLFYLRLTVRADGNSSFPDLRKALDVTCNAYDKLKYAQKLLNLETTF